MTSQWLVLLAMFLTGGLSSYTTTVASRGPQGSKAILGQGPVRSISGGLGFLALVAGVIWGFVHFTWYIVLLALVGILLLNGFIYGGRRGFAFWYSVQPILDVLCILGAFMLWIML